MNLNKAELIGRITKDPEIRSLPSGKQVAKFSVATNHIFKNAAGEKQETAQFHNCVAFGKLAEIIGRYVQKGQEVYLSGRIEYRSWEKKDGSGKAYATEIVVESLQMGQKAQTKDERMSPAAPATEPKGKESIPVVEEEEIRVEDIPF